MQILNMTIQSQTILEEYERKKHDYEKYTEKMYNLIESLLKENNFKIHSLDRRTKDLKSLEDKLVRKGDSYNKLTDITDLSGIRIICYLLSEIDEVANIIEQNFTILPEFSLDKKKLLDPDRFGYLSLHYVVKLSNCRSNLTEYQKYQDLLCEIQIRTILQHSWAEIEHDLGYKSVIEIPRDIKRRFFRLASILELADDEFINLKSELEHYSKELNKYNFEDNKDVYIDSISLDKYLSTNSMIQELNKDISQIMNCKLNNTVPALDMNLKPLSYFGINKIDELHKKIVTHRAMIIFIAEKINKDKPRSPNSYITKGISLHYLGFALIWDKETDKINEYMSSIGFNSGNQGIINNLKLFYDEYKKNRVLPNQY